MVRSTYEINPIRSGQSATLKSSIPQTLDRASLSVAFFKIMNTIDKSVNPDLRLDMSMDRYLTIECNKAVRGAMSPDIVHHTMLSHRFSNGFSAFIRVTWSDTLTTACKPFPFLSNSSVLQTIKRDSLLWDIGHRENVGKALSVSLWRQVTVK